MPLTNTEEAMDRFEHLKEVASNVGGAFLHVKKMPKYGEYMFEAEWNPSFQNTEEYKRLSTEDILGLVDKSPWYFGGKIKSRDSKRVSGVVYTE